MWNIYQYKGVIMLCPEGHKPEKGEKIESFVGSEVEARNHVRRKFPNARRFQLILLPFGLAEWVEF